MTLMISQTLYRFYSPRVSIVNLKVNFRNTRGMYDTNKCIKQVNNVLNK